MHVHVPRLVRKSTATTNKYNIYGICAYGEKNPTIYCFHFFFFFFFLASPRRTNKFRSKSAKSNAKWAAKLSDDDECCTMLCTLYAVYYRRSHRYESLTQTQPPSLPCAATALPLRCQWWPSFAARQRRSMNWAELLGRILFDFFEGGGEGGRLCALNFGFVFISCVIFVSLQYKKEKQKTTSTPTKWRLLLAKKLWKQAKCNEMKKKVFRNGHQLYSKFFFFWFGLVFSKKWKYATSSSWFLINKK